mgnify:CR=1 FL=1
MNQISSIIFIALIISLFITGCSMTGMSVNTQDAEEPNVEKQPIRLGYCPTMSAIAEEIAIKNSHVSLVSYDFTVQALQSLNNKEVDVVLVGRLAEENEVGEIFEKRLRDGLTLVGKEKKLISMDNLQRSKIHTYVSKEQAQEYIPNIDNVIFHGSSESAISSGLDDLVLIRWSDFSEDLELVIPIDENMNKIEKFRIPVLYSYDDANIKNVVV